MSASTHKLNYNPIVFDFKTKKYCIGDYIFNKYKDAKSKQWKCEKCDQSFANFKNLRRHKIDCHSY